MGPEPVSGGVPSDTPYGSPQRADPLAAVSLVTVGAIVGFGGLGNLIYAGMNTYFKAQVLTASGLCVVIAVAADVLLLGVQRLITPWTRAARG